MKYLIAGLGNIGVEYQNTRHNIGFQVVDTFVGEQKSGFRQERYAYVAYTKLKGRTLVLIKPTTYMNLSGKAVNYWLQKENIEIENMLVVLDDLALPFGTIRMKKRGSDAGHNGLINIIETLGTQEFGRLRFGIGKEFSKGEQIDYVLGNWSDEELKKLPERIEKMCEAIKSFASVGMDRTMNYFNGQ